MSDSTNDFSPFALVADDEPLIRMDATDILNNAGFRAIEVSNGEAAIEMLEKYEGWITLLFTDVQMGHGMNGFELARLTCKRWPEIKVLVASGLIVPKDGELPDGAVFINKPFSAALVTNRLRELLPEEKKPEPLKNGRSR